MLEALVIAGMVAAPLGSATLFLPARNRARRAGAWAALWRVVRAIAGSAVLAAAALMACAYLRGGRRRCARDRADALAGRHTPAPSLVRPVQSPAATTTTPAPHGQFTEHARRHRQPLSGIARPHRAGREHVRYPSLSGPALPEDFPGRRGERLMLFCLDRLDRIERRP